MTAIDVVEENKDYIVFYKGSGIPTVPLKKDPEGSSLLIEAKRLFPEIAEPMGKNYWEGGILHRLDTPTSGLVLAARSRAFYDKMIKEQDAGRFIKYYRAESAFDMEVPGFTDCPYDASPGTVIKSAFIAYGPGRKAVRPVLPGSRKWEEGMASYDTEILACEKNILRVRLAKGFRHQVRCHSAWLGMPLLGDTLYGGRDSDRFGLVSYRIEFLGNTVEASED